MKLKASSCSQREHGQEVGQALPGSRGLRGLERLTDLLTVLPLCILERLELRTVRALCLYQHRAAVGRLRCPLRGAVQQGAQATFAAIAWLGELRRVADSRAE